MHHCAPGALSVALEAASLQATCGSSRHHNMTPKPLWDATPEETPPPVHCLFCFHAFVLACPPVTDVFSLQGVYPGFPTKLPGVPGFDGRLVAASG